MDFKLITKLWLLPIVLMTVISCEQKADDKSPFHNQETPHVVFQDSIIFKTSSEEYLYLGKRLYPANNSDSMSPSVTDELITLESVGDTVFAFLNSEMLTNRANKKLPFATDSLLSDYYPKYYEVEIDDNIPYMAYLRSDKDYIQFIKKKDGGYYIENAVIRDTVLNVLGELKIGMSKSEVLSILKFPLEAIEKESFSLILSHGAVPSKIWYKKDVYPNKELTPSKPTIQVYLLFEKGKLLFASINPWIGYGSKGKLPFQSLKD